MKLAIYATPRGEPRCIAVVAGDWLVPVELLDALAPLLRAGGMPLEALALAARLNGLTDDAVTEATAIAERGEARLHRIGDVRLLAPVQPPQFRDFYAFEEHVRSARRRRGLEVPPEWYTEPVFYFSNTAGIVGPEAAIQKPTETNELDYELEIAAVIGVDSSGTTAAEADELIAGYTILNDFSARDIQRREMKVGLGPAKGKDFATSIGPWLVTPDELEGRAVHGADGNRYRLEMTARVNGVEYSRGNFVDIHFPFSRLIEVAARNTRLQCGDLIGSGTVGTGCITEFAEGTYPWLTPGDIVELEVEHLGVLRNTIA